MTDSFRELAGSYRGLSVDDYYHGVRQCDVAVLARALTLIESTNVRHQSWAEELLTRLLPHTGQSIRLGITGAPGAGKSTFIESLGLLLTSRGKRVAVLAVDPSSGVSGGSILGDKTRMTGLSENPAAYIRPSPSTGLLGGVARTTRESILVCEAAGYDVVLIETVGVGQSETAVSEMTDSLLTIMLPGAGDELQGIKRGLLELTDVIVVNKADGDTRLAAKHAAQQYCLALKSRVSKVDRMAPRIMTCSALYHHGVEDVWSEVQRRHEKMASNGALQQRRQKQNLDWLWATVDDWVRQAVHQHDAVRAIRDNLENEVLAGKVTARTAAHRILDTVGLVKKSR